MERFDGLTSSLTPFRTGTHMIRLKDIAERAGVSIMTVSKALRDAPDISEATKLRLRALASEMGYVPDSLAQGLRTRNSRLLGLVISTITNPVFARMMLAIEEKATAAGYELLLAHSLNEPEREAAALRRFIARRVEGILVAPVYRLNQSAGVYDEIQRCGIPTVILGHRTSFCSRFCGVETDDLQGSSIATRHLLALGHRRIAFLAGPATSPWARERLDGFRRALREADLEPDDRLVFSAGATIEEGEKAALQLLHETTGVTAIQAVNDFVAIGAAEVLKRQEIRIPEDMSMIGYGDILMSGHYRVPLTTIHQPKFRLGETAMDLMLQAIRGVRPESRRLPVSLVVRSSTELCRSEPEVLAVPV
jgi:LacI family transcriptional regulator